MFWKMFWKEWDMSYDIYLKSDACPTCGQSGSEPDCPDPTYNLTPIFDLALTGEPLPNPETPEVAVILFHKATDRPRGLRLLSGRKAKDTLSDLNHALDRMADERLHAAFVALEPENGWGDLAGAVHVMEQLKELAEEHPDNTWEIH